jgi:hypothetical protein
MTSGGLTSPLAIVGVPGRPPFGQMHTRLSWYSQLAEADGQAWCCTFGPIVDACGACSNRRWQRAIAITVLSLLVALVAGTALPPQFVAVALTSPAPLSHGTQAGGAHAGFDVDRVRLPAGPRIASDFVRASSSDSAPRNKNPFHGMWMTRDRPPIWSRLSPNALWPSVPSSLAAVGFSPTGAHSVAPAAADQNIWTKLCVARC